jgi:hypothetical protein
VTNWRESTDTMTAGEIVEYVRDGNEIMITSNLAKNTIYLNYDQAANLISGIAGIMNEIRRDQGI